MLTLRPYQTEGVEAVFDAFRRGVEGPAAVLATGAGKSVMIGAVAKRFRQQTGKRVVVLAHRTELVEQNADKIRQIAPELGVGIVKAERNQTMAEVISASVQTLSSPTRRAMLRDVGLVVVDECHHAPAASYRNLLDHFGEGGAKRLGFTATMTRGDDLALGDVWTEVVCTVGTQDLVGEGWLVHPVGRRVKVADLDLGSVRVTAGDYQAEQLGAAIEASLAPEAIAKAMAEHARGRQTILFAPTVHSAQVIAEKLREADFTAETVSYLTAPAERAAVLERYRNGVTQVLCNAMVFTEGTDLPMTSCVVIARPTRSHGLFIQMAGRGLRLWPGKDDCLILMIAGAGKGCSLAAPIELFGEEQAARLDRELNEDDEDRGDDVGLELAAEREEGTGLDEDMGVDGPLVAEAVDLFHGSRSAWKRTYAGIWFLVAGDSRYIAICPPGTLSPDRYDVVSMHAKRHGESRWVLRGATDQGYAMAWAEDDVNPSERSLATKAARWRQAKPSQALLTLAHSLRLQVTEGMTSGQVSDMIDRHKASARIDGHPSIQAWIRTRGW